MSCSSIKRDGRSGEARRGHLGEEEPKKKSREAGCRRRGGVSEVDKERERVRARPSEEFMSDWSTRSEREVQEKPVRVIGVFLFPQCPVAVSWASGCYCCPSCWRP